jgi:hypothetical protein
VERRLDTRHPARTVVYLLLPDGRRHACSALELSATGLLLQAPDIGLSEGQKVELAFMIHIGRITHLLRRRATVAHVSSHGTGFRIDSAASR